MIASKFPEINVGNVLSASSKFFIYFFTTLNLLCPGNYNTFYSAGGNIKVEKFCVICAEDW
jgi:hypothetical protein